MKVCSECKVIAPMIKNCLVADITGIYDTPVISIVREENISSYNMFQYLCQCAAGL